MSIATSPRSSCAFAVSRSLPGRAPAGISWLPVRTLKLLWYLGLPGERDKLLEVVDGRLPQMMQMYGLALMGTFAGRILFAAIQRKEGANYKLPCTLP